MRKETTISLSQEGEKTRIDWRMRFPTLVERDRVERDYGVAIGLSENLERLGDFVEESAGPVFVISRRFAAPRDLLWKALTEPERMAQWFGPKGVPVVAAQMDFRPGGSYHYGLRTPDGGAMWGLFAYREIEAPDAHHAHRLFLRRKSRAHTASAQRELAAEGRDDLSIRRGKTAPAS